MKVPVSIANAEHYLWGEACDGWHLRRRDDLSIIEERMPPEAREQCHFHSQSRQFSYVLEGELTRELSGQHHLLNVGSGIEIAPGQPHQAFNRSNKGFLVISQPRAKQTGNPHGDWPFLENVNRRCYKTEMDKVIRSFENHTEMKAAEYHYWQSRPVHERMAAVSQITCSLYAMKDTSPDVFRLQRTVVVLQRPQR